MLLKDSVWHKGYAIKTKGVEIVENYTAKDVLEMAVKAKSKGVDMYMALARNSENYHVSNLFAEMAKDEQHHKIELQKWMASIKEEGQKEAYPGERSLFLQALADKNAYHCNEATKKALEKTISEEDALKAGVTFEKDFMLFLHEIKREVASGGAKVIDKLIEDEMKHIRQFFELSDKK
ncbi:MAG: hypothetical protein HQL29_01595 [Candidatus Omnitrophica bacterium]|nr:hypothetical protein [Candidatus Omnitrophota bacterium]